MVVEAESQHNIFTCVRAHARAFSVELVIPRRVIWKGEGTTKIEDGNTVDDDNVGGWQELYKFDTETKGVEGYSSSLNNIFNINISAAQHIISHAQETQARLFVLSVLLIEN